MDLSNQIELEKLYNKNQTMRRLKAEMSGQGNELFCQEHSIPFEFAKDLIAQMCLHKRSLFHVMVSILRRHFTDDPSVLNASQTCADMILKAVDVDLVHLDETMKGDLELVIALDVSPEVRAEIDLYQYPLPMVVEPKKVNDNTDIGLFTLKGSIILKHNHHEDDVCLDHINRVNSVPYRINPETVRLVRNAWKDLDHQRIGEELKDYQARVKAFEKYDRVSRDVIDTLVMTGAPFWLTNKYDKRGRTYAQGYHVNPQGNAWNKAVIEFAEPELVTV